MQVQGTMPTLRVKSLWVGFYLDMTPSDLFKSANLIARKKCTRAGLLKIMEANNKRCPVCEKPVFFALHAPQDSTLHACSDIDCVNAHGIVDWGMPKEKEKMKDIDEIQAKKRLGDVLNIKYLKGSHEPDNQD